METSYFHFYSTNKSMAKNAFGLSNHNNLELQSIYANPKQSIMLLKKKKKNSELAFKTSTTLYDNKKTMYGKIHQCSNEHELIEQIINLYTLHSNYQVFPSMY